MITSRPPASSAQDIAVVDVTGHSYAVGVGATFDTRNYVDKLCRLLGGVRLRRDLAQGGGIACWPYVSGSFGTGGWGRDIGLQYLHFITPTSGWGGPYLPVRDLAIVHYGLNDLAQLGAGNLNPYQQAMRNLVSERLACNIVQTSDASWTLTGTWLNGHFAGLVAGPTSFLSYTNTLNSTATLAVPADFPGGGQVLAITFNVPNNNDVTVGITVDGVSQQDLRLQSSALIDTNATGGPQSNQYVLRFNGGTYPLLTPGAHTIVLTLKTQTIAGSYMEIDAARVEAAPSQAPIIVLPGANRCLAYTFWSSFANGASMGDAGIPSVNAVLKAVAAEFGPNVLFVDLDQALNKSAANFYSDNVHPNDYGHSLIAEAIYNAIADSNLPSAGRQGFTNPRASVRGTNFPGLTNAPAFQNSWANFSGGNTPAYPPFRYYRDLTEGRVWIEGAIAGGTLATAIILTMFGGYTPASPKYFTGFSSTGALQIWELDASGNLSIISGGDTVRSVLPAQSYDPAQ